MRRSLLLVVLLAACAPRVGSAPSPTSPPAVDAIRQDELRRDLVALAGDAFRGREAGTIDELRAAAWTADRAREAGLEPAGDNGTFFQFWPMQQVRTAAGSRVAIDGQPLTLGEGAAVVRPTDAALELPLVWVGEGRAADLEGQDLSGKAVAAVLSAPANLPPRWVSLWHFRYAAGAIRERAAELAKTGAAAIVLVADSTAQGGWDYLAANHMHGSYDVAGDTARAAPAGPPVVWLRSSELPRVRAAQRLSLDLAAERFVYPSVNVVARVPGTDPALRGEYVLFSGHTDHDGVRYTVGGDSIWNGADDNASVSVALLAIGRAFHARPAARSALFVWHGAEERGLLGSRWYVAHPTVPRDSIVAVLNADMIGRNSPDSAALLGVTPPHRNSVALAQAAFATNPGFAIDTTWDAASHPERWYFRSDHLPYARAGIPAIMFSTLLHADYHTPDDEPDRIDYAKLRRMTEWMYATGWMVANAPERPDADPNSTLER